MKIKVTYNVKPKSTQELEVTSFEDLQKQIYEKFDLEAGSLVYMKPRLKNQESFEKQVKDGIEILMRGKIKAKQQEKQKEKTAQQLQKIKKKEEEVERLKQELKLNPHQRIVKRLKDSNITQRGIQYLNPDTEKPQNLGVDYALCPLFLLKLAKQFKEYCQKYSCMQKNPDGLIIEELGTMFKEMDKSQGVICPLNWISAWICYCSDDIEYPYPTYGIDYFLNRLFSTMKMAFDVQLQKKEEEPDSRMDYGTKFFGIEMLTRRLDITKLDPDDKEEEKEIEKKVIKYFLQCDLSNPEIKDLHSGIKERFKEKELWRNFYAFDIQYKETIITMERLPKYLFVHCSRWGYPKAREEWEEVEFSEEAKSYHEVRIPRILDLYDFCDNTLKEKLQFGRIERQQMFYPYNMDERFQEFKTKIPNKEYYDEKRDANELNYMYLDYLLQARGIFDAFWDQPLKNSKQTGQFRLIGMVLHRGDFYHRPKPQHKHGDQGCKGQFMALVHRKGTEWVKYHGSEVQIIPTDEAMNPKLWGKRTDKRQWTPVLLMYQEIYMRNIQVELPPAKDPRRTRTRQHRGIA